MRFSGGILGGLAVAVAGDVVLEGRVDISGEDGVGTGLALDGSSNGVGLMVVEEEEPSWITEVIERTTSLTLVVVVVVLG